MYPPHHLASLHSPLYLFSNKRYVSVCLNKRTLVLWMWAVLGTGRRQKRNVLSVCCHVSSYSESWLWWPFHLSLPATCRPRSNHYVVFRTRFWKCWLRFGVLCSLVQSSLFVPVRQRLSGWGFFFFFLLWWKQNVISPILFQYIYYFWNLTTQFYVSVHWEDNKSSLSNPEDDSTVFFNTSIASSSPSFYH